MPPQVSLDDQIFWRPRLPPLPKRPVPPLRAMSREQSSRKSPGREVEVRDIQSAESPIVISSDEESDAGDIVGTSGDDEEDDSQQIVSKSSPSDDTLPSLEAIIASLDNTPCGDAGGPEKETSTINEPAIMADAGRSWDDRSMTCSPPATIPLAEETPESVHCAFGEELNHNYDQPDGSELGLALTTQPSVTSARRRSPRRPRVRCGAAHTQRSPERSALDAVGASPTAADSRAPRGAITESDNATVSRHRGHQIRSPQPQAPSRVGSEPASDSDRLSEAVTPNVMPDDDDDDFSPSSADVGEIDRMGGDQASDSEDDEPPRKRCRSTRKTKRRVHTGALQSPPPSHCSDDVDNGPLDSASFEEWSGKVQLTTINGVTSFEGEFEGELTWKVVHALLHTLSARNLPRKLPRKLPQKQAERDVSRHDGRRGQRGRFMREEDDLLVALRSERGSSWKETHRDFSKQFPGRSLGTLQVHYCTKLKDRH